MQALKTTYHTTRQYMEIDIDVSANSTAAYITGMVRGATSGLVIDLGEVALSFEWLCDNNLRPMTPPLTGITAICSLKECTGVEPRGPLHTQSSPKATLVTDCSAFIFSKQLILSVYSDSIDHPRQLALFVYLRFCARGPVALGASRGTHRGRPCEPP